ncbi:MAG: hypothetical protein AAB320_09085 [Elusimicrobiota bacterium]
MFCSGIARPDSAADGLIHERQVAAGFQEVPPTRQESDRFDAFLGGARKPISQFFRVLLRLRALCANAPTDVFAQSKIQ